MANSYLEAKSRMGSNIKRKLMFTLNEFFSLFINKTTRVTRGNITKSFSTCLTKYFCYFIVFNSFNTEDTEPFAVFNEGMIM